MAAKHEVTISKFVTYEYYFWQRIGTRFCMFLDVTLLVVNPKYFLRNCITCPSTDTQLFFLCVYVCVYVCACMFECVCVYLVCMCLQASASAADLCSDCLSARVRGLKSAT